MVHQSTISKVNSLMAFCYFLSLYTLSLFMTASAHAIDTLYLLDTVNSSVNQNSPAQGLSDQSIANVHLDNTMVSNLKPDTLIDVPLPNGKWVKGKMIDLKNSTGPARSATAFSVKQRKVVSFTNSSGSVELTLVDNVVTEMLLHDVAQEKIYHADINTSGDGRLYLQDNNDHYCVRYPENAIAPQTIAQNSPQIAAAIPSLNTLKNLQGRPGSANVLYINYWGGSLTGTAWNANFNSNNAINYTPFDRDNNTASFTNAERYSMWLAWREAVEDFAPFNINVTTSQSVYNATPVSNRLQIIVTKTSSWYGSAGGVAYVNIFNENSDYYKTGWTWNLSDSSMGMTISHEAGHQLGLHHDGEGARSYYQGHGVWGPIMGAPFGQQYVQWSKGEYLNANQSEDDIAIVNDKLGSIGDEAGNGYASATPLSLPVNNARKLIGFNDTDAYRFTMGASGTATIKVITVLGDEDEARAANLSMNVSLVKLNSNGGVTSTISTSNSTDNTPLSPLTNVFEYSNTLGTGTYGLRITPNSPNTNWTSGFGSYGIAGEYRLSVSTTVQNAPDLIVAPVSVNNNSLTQGQNFNIAATVRNQGNSSAGNTTLRYYLSTNSTINNSDMPLATDPVAALSTNGTSAESAAVTAPASAGTYWVGACVDSVNNESDLQNNCSAAVQITVSVATAPDLVTDSVFLNTTSLRPNQRFNISARTLNQGSADSSSTLLRYFRSTNSTISRADTQLGTDNVGSLNPNSSSLQSTEVSAPSTRGSYWIGVCVDTVVNESNTDNNCSNGNRIEVTNNPTPQTDDCTFFRIPAKNNKYSMVCL